MPLVFVTVELSFGAAGLKAGERVLIHAGSGGVGLAAIQMAHAAGAEVFATASAPKQAFLRGLGVKHVFDSRQTQFGQQILDATGGEGVHVVLNSLTGEGFIDASLSCLAKGGRFVELGRRDILSAEEMATVRPDAAYHVINVDEMKTQEPGRLGEALTAVMERVAAGELHPIHHSRWSMSEPGAAFKFMQSARHVGKLVLARSALQTGRLREDGTYLITGGLGGIGCALAGRLADLGAGAIVLNGRRDPDPEAVETIAALRERGVNVQVELADVTDSAAVDAMLERIDSTLPPLAGVIHCVGVLSDAALANQTWESFRQVVWPKVIGAWRLHEATIDRDLDMFVLFSSAAGVMGNPGQVNHAAANVFLDQLAAHRRALGLPGQAIAWGAWSDIGEAAEQRGRIEERLGAGGTGWFTPQQGLEAFELLTRQDVTGFMVAAMDWQRHAEGQAENPPFMDDLLSVSQGAGAEAGDSAEDLLSQLGAPTPIDTQAVLATFLQRELQAVMRLPSAPSHSVGFFELGMDSLMAVEFRNRLNRAFAGEYVVSNTAVFDHPDIAALSQHLSAELAGAGVGRQAAPAAAPAAPIARPAAATDSASDGIAIVGMACRLPQAANLSEYWRLLDEGVDAVTEGRPNSDLMNGLRMPGAFIDDVDLFDSRFFRIAPVEARIMDPQQRLLLETAWEALEDAGMAPDSLRGSRTGIFAGVTRSEYRDIMDAVFKTSSYLGTSPGVAVGRLAFALGLEGPAVPVDMTCASSLAAIHQAAGSLRTGEVNLALAGGVHLVLSQAVNEFMTEAGMLSRTGRSRPFDASADGYIRGEGCGILVLKRLSDAEADGDRIWGVIRGSAVNQNGASAGLTVPNGSAQERVMEAALAQANLAGADVDYLEAHATGSVLGDAIEMRAVGAVYGRGRGSDDPLIVGTVKSNFGHLEAAAGVAGVLKAVLAMQHGTIPRHLHFDDPNPEIDWAGLPVRIASEPAPWPASPSRPPRAAVSAFGISGANAHLVLEGYGSPAVGSENGDGSRLASGAPTPVPASAQDATPASEELSERAARFLPLSGKTPGALRDLAARYLAWLEQRADTLSSAADGASTLADMAWTAGVGRSHFAYRAGAPFRDVASLQAALSAVAEADAKDDALEPQPVSRVAFLYGGESGDWAGMARELYDTEPTARAVLDACDAVVREERGASLLDVMFGREGAQGDLGDAAWAVPALYSLECALTALWSDVGVRPHVVMGTSAGGELAAAQAASVFSLEDGLRIALARGDVASNGGDASGMEAALSGVAFSQAAVAVVDCETGETVDSGALSSAAHWAGPEREAAEWPARIVALLAAGADAVIDVGAGAVVAAGGERAALGVVDGRPRSFAEVVASAYQAGVEIAFEGLFAGESRSRIALPTYPFQRRRHWI